MDWERLDLITKWDESALPAVLGIAALTIGFIVYYFTLSSKKMEARYLKQFGEEKGQARWVIFQRIWGGLWLGVPALILPLIFLEGGPSEYGMGFSVAGEDWLIILVLGGILIGMNLYRAGKPANLEHYPQIRTKKWDMPLFLGSSFGWIIYLLGYELAFRGLLLFGCAEVMGVWPAIAINASLYAFAHFFKGINETVAAIPFGIIISIISLYTGNFMVAFLVHCCIALSNQSVAFFAHPDMELVRK